MLKHRLSRCSATLVAPGPALQPARRRIQPPAAEPPTGSPVLRAWELWTSLSQTAPKFQPNSKLKQAAPGREAASAWLATAGSPASVPSPCSGVEHLKDKGLCWCHGWQSPKACDCLLPRHRGPWSRAASGGLCPLAAPCPPQVPAPRWAFAAALTPLTPCGLASCSGGVSWESQEGKSFWGLCDRSKGSHRGCSLPAPTPHATLCPLPTLYRHKGHGPTVIPGMPSHCPHAAHPGAWSPSGPGDPQCARGSPSGQGGTPAAPRC